MADLLPSPVRVDIRIRADRLGLLGAAVVAGLVGLTE
jgi:hypothetical protein